MFFYINVFIQCYITYFYIQCLVIVVSVICMYTVSGVNQKYTFLKSWKMSSSLFPSGIVHALVLTGSGFKSGAIMNLGSTTCLSFPFGHLKWWLLDVRMAKLTFRLWSGWNSNTIPEIINYDDDIIILSYHMYMDAWNKTWWILAILSHGASPFTCTYL